MHPLTFGLDEIRDYHARRLITVREQDNLIICNYSQKCTYSKSWDHITEQCRGLILRLDQPYQQATKIEEVVALPFKKFFNLGEDGRQPTAPLVEIAEKMDGSLGILYRVNGEYRVATRGAFDSEQAKWATNWIQERSHVFSGFPSDSSMTLIFEIIYPDNRVVIDYGERAELVLLGIRDRFTGDDWPRIDVWAIAHHFGFSTPERYAGVQIEELIEQAKTLNANLEGWVCKFADGSRFKIKGQGYLAIQKLLKGLTRDRVIEAMLADSLDSWMMTLPEEFLPEVQAWRDEIEGDISLYLNLVEYHFRVAPKENRKEYAIYAKENATSLFTALMFARLDGRDCRKMILKDMLK